MLRSVVGFSRHGHQTGLVGGKETNGKIPAWFVLGHDAILVRAVVDFPKEARA
jgi:hypothetical protein